MRDTRLKIVVLPAPLGPMIVKTWPASTSKLTPSRARMPPKLIARFSAEKTVTGGAPSAWRPSPESLRAHVGLLPPEGGLLVQRKEREVELDLGPAPVDAQGLKEDEEHEDQPEDAGLEPGLLHEPIDPEKRGVPGVLAEDPRHLP